MQAKSNKFILFTLNLGWNQWIFHLWIQSLSGEGMVESGYMMWLANSYYII